MRNLKTEFKDLNDKHRAFAIFNTACRENDMEVIKFLTQKAKYRKLVNSDLNTGFVNACFSNNIEIVKYLLNEPSLTMHAKIYFRNYEGFLMAARMGHLPLVQYLLTSPELKEKANIHAKDDSALIGALRMNQINVVDYLLNALELTEHSNIDSAFTNIANKTNIEMVKRMTSRDLYSCTHDEKLFIMAYQNEHLDAVKYLIFDRDIPKTEIIDTILWNLPNDSIAKMFELREINKHLNNELKSNQINTKKTKI